jgi:hypothetical protein
MVDDTKRFMFFLIVGLAMMIFAMCYKETLDYTARTEEIKSGCSCCVKTESESYND